MRDIQHKASLRKKILTTAITTSLGISASSIPGLAISDVYVWGSLTLSADPTVSATTLCDPALTPANADASPVLFTILDGNGAPLTNSSIPAGDAKTGFNNQFQTPTCGTFTYDTDPDGDPNTDDQAGTANLAPFEFFSGDPSLLATAAGITFNKLSVAESNNTGNTLLLANMLFDWNTNFGIPVSTVWDAQSLLAEMDGTPTTFTLNADGTLDGSETALSALGATPATDGIYTNTDIPGTGDGPNGFPGYLALGPIPIATTAWLTTADCTPAVDCLGKAISGILPITEDPLGVIDTPDWTINTGATAGGNTGIGSTPMLDGPFNGSYANFDFTSMKLVSFTDNTPPDVTLVGAATINLIVGDPDYTGGTATCQDAPPLDAFTPTAALNTASAAAVPISTATPSTTVLTYECTDATGNVGTVIRTVNVQAPDALITLTADTNGDISPVSHECATPYTDAGATCVDPEDGAILGTASPLANNLFSLDQTNVDLNIGNLGGPYIAKYTCRDNDLNQSVLDRNVNIADTTAPAVTLNANVDPGSDTFESSTTENPVTYTDSGASVIEGCDITTPATIFSSAAVNVVVPDTGNATIPYPLPYTTTDGSGNVGTITRTVNVTRAQPVITLIGGGEVLDVDATYTEQGMDIIDAQDTDQNGIITSGSAGGLTFTINGTVDTSTSGEYTLTYDAIDSNGNAATQRTRTVTVGVFAAGSNFSMLDRNGNVFGGTNDVAFGWDETSYNTDEADTDFSLMTIETVKPQEFFSFVWQAHHIRIFENTGATPRTLTFDTTCTNAQLEAGMGGPGANCDGPFSDGQTEQFISMTINPGQIGAHILFDWNVSSNIDVVNVWDRDTVWERHGATGETNKLWDGISGAAPDPASPWKLVSTDFDGDNINGAPMVDGPFQGSNANFNAGPGGTVIKDPIDIVAPATDIGDSGLASFNLWGIFASLVTLLGLRRFTTKK